MPNLICPSRRSFMADAATRLLGVSFAGYTAGHSNSAFAQTAQATPAGKAKSVIYLYMTGAMSHLDTFDPKPGVSSQGETQPGKTSVPGIQISDKLPKLAFLMNEIALVRSLTTVTGAHEQGNYLMHTSYGMINSIRHPAMGAWAAHTLPKRAGSLPANVLVGSSAGHPGSGFLPASIAPVPIYDASIGLENTKSPSYLEEDQFKHRMSLANQYDQTFKRAYTSRLVEAYDHTYREALKLMNSNELSVFDIKQEDEKTRKLYGEDALGQGCLLARRLVQAGVKFIEVEFGSWDHHQDIYTRLPKMCENLDNALGALIKDLKTTGLLKDTLVVLATEFGRTPIINENAGRDHHPGVFSSLLCGAGIQGGAVFGKSDEIGQSPDEDGVQPPDFNATIAAAMGLPLQQQFIAPNGRPFKICDNGQPIAKLLA